MNPNPIEDLFKKAANVQLDQRRKEAIGQELLECMRKHPAQQATGRQFWFGFASGWPEIFAIKNVYGLLACMMVFFLAGGMISVKADQSLPGDLLYSVKSFNENVAKALAFSDQEKINLNIMLAERRLQEAETLIANNTLANANEAQLGVGFAKETIEFSRHMHALQLRNTKESMDGALVQNNAHFESLLKAHSNILKNIESQKNEHILDPLLKSIDQSASDLSSQKAATADTLINANRTDVLKKQAAIQNGLEPAQEAVLRVQAMIELQKQQLGAAATAQAQQNLNIAQQKIQEGNQKITTQDYNKAFSSFEDASQIASQTQQLINAKNNLHLDINLQINPQDSVGSSGQSTGNGGIIK